MLFDQMDKEMVQALIETIPMEVTIIDAKDEVVGWNKHEKRLFRRPLTSMGLSFRQCHPEKSLTMVERIVEEMRQGAILDRPRLAGRRPEAQGADRVLRAARRYREIPRMHGMHAGRGRNPPPVRRKAALGLDDVKKTSHAIMFTQSTTEGGYRAKAIPHFRSSSFRASSKSMNSPRRASCHASLNDSGISGSRVCRTCSSTFQRSSLGRRSIS